MFSVMHTRLVPLLILWPERDILKMSMPMSFRSKFGKCACIIDCFEVFIERPSDLKARAQTYSTYKSHNTMKFLIGILLHKVQSPLFPRGGGGVVRVSLTFSPRDVLVHFLMLSMYCILGRSLLLFPGIIPRMHFFTRLHLLFLHACPKKAIFLLII